MRLTPLLRKRRLRLRDLDNRNLDSELLVALVRDRRISVLKRIFGSFVSMLFYYWQRGRRYRVDPEVVYADDEYVVVRSVNWSADKEAWYGDGLYDIMYVFCRSEDSFWSAHRVPYNRITTNVKSKRDVRVKLLGYNVDLPETETSVISLEEGDIARLQGDLVICLRSRDLTKTGDYLANRLGARVFVKMWKRMEQCIANTYAPIETEAFNVAMEHNKEAYRRLKRFIRKVTGVKRVVNIRKRLEDAIKKVSGNVARKQVQVLGKYLKTLLLNYYDHMEAVLRIHIGRHVVEVVAAPDPIEIYFDDYADRLPVQRILRYRKYNSFRILVLRDFTEMKITHEGGEHSARVYYLTPGVYEITLLERHHRG